MAASTGAVTNTFDAETSLDPTIFETFETENTDHTYYNEKHNVTVNVKNLDYAVYVRAAVLVNWKNAAGDVLGKEPVLETDYSLDPGDSRWFEHGGFYYYSKMISGAGVEKETANLIDSVKVLKPAPEEGYTLNVEIIAQTIQARGSTDTHNTPAVIDAWDININDAKELVAPSP